MLASVSVCADDVGDLLPLSPEATDDGGCTGVKIHVAAGVVLGTSEGSNWIPPVLELT